MYRKESWVTRKSPGSWITHDYTHFSFTNNVLKARTKANIMETFPSVLT